MKFQELINTGFPEQIEAKRKRINHLLTILNDPNGENPIVLDKESYQRLYQNQSNHNPVKINSDNHNQLFNIPKPRKGNRIQQ